MVDQSPINANELAEEAGLSTQCLDIPFREEHAYLLAEFCDPWEEIGYHLKMTRSDISSINGDRATVKMKTIAMLQTWKERFAHRATYRVLIEAMLQSGHAQQALNICQKLKHEHLPATQSDLLESDRIESVMPQSNPSLSLIERNSSSTHHHDHTSSEAVLDVTQSLYNTNPEDIIESESTRTDQTLISWSEDEVAVRDYFSRMTCNIRVLGSQLGLEPHELDEIEYSSPFLCVQKQRLVDKCISKEKLTSWEHLVAVLEKPALNLRRMIGEVRSKHIKYSLSSISSPMSLEASFSSSMEVDQKFTIPEAVNLIVAVDIGLLEELGRKLGVDEAKLNGLSEYKGVGRHQRLIEAWFELTTPSRNTLLEVLPRRGSSVSMSSLPPTPTFEPPSDIESQISDFEIRFSELQADTEAELTKRNKTVQSVSARLRALPPRLSKDSNMAYIKKLSSSNQEKPKTLEELFCQLNPSCWNCFEYELLEFVIKSNRCSKPLENRMNKYAEDMKRFKDTTTISTFIKHGKQFYKLKNVPQDHKVVRTKQHINPEENTLSYFDRIREDIWSTMKLSECIAHFHEGRLQMGCVEMEWLMPEEYDYDLIFIFCAEAGRKLMEQHHIEKIYINDVLIDNSLFLLTAAFYEIWGKVDSLLTEEIDLNASKHMTGETALFFVAANGKEDLVRKMLDLGAEPNVKNHDGKSPLMFAAEHGHEMVILLLLDHGTSIDFKQESTGRTALFFAAENGHDVATSILLAYGADPHQKDVDGETPYAVAEKKGYENVCEELQPPEMKKQPEVKSDSLQHRYIAETYQGLSKQFQSFKISLFGQDRVAIVRENQDLIEAAKNDDFKTVEHILQKERDLTTSIDARESDKHGWTALMWASDRGNNKIVQLLLNKGASLNKLSKTTEWSPLMIASRKGHLKVVKLLLERGAVIDHQNINGLTSLGISLFEKRTAVAMFLIHKGANIHLAEKTGWNPMIRASAEGNLKLVKIIADLGGHLNSVTMFNWTSVMQAAKFGHDEVVKELAKRGADLTITTKDGDTVFHIATLRRQPGVIKQLATAEQPDDARAKFNLNIPNRDGLTALMVATNKGYQEEIDALLEGGADVNVTHEATRWTAIFFAAKNGSVEIVQNLLHHGAKTELDDGTRLTDVASHLKQMSIIHILGTDVDSKPAPQHQQLQPRNIDHTVRTFDAIFSAIEERVMTWTKVA